MKTKIMKKINKTVALILSILLVITIVDSRILNAEAVDESVNITVSVTDTESAAVSDATIKLMQKGVDGAPDNEIGGVSWTETSGEYMANVTVDTDMEYYVIVSADGYQNILSDAKPLVAGANTYSVTMKKVLDSITVKVVDSSDADVKIETASVALYKGGESTILDMAQTDDEGTVIFTGGTFVEGETYKVVVTKAGYKENEENFEITASMGTIAVELDAIVPFTVVVTDESGSFINDAAVRFTDEDDNEVEVTNATNGEYTSLGDVVGSNFTIDIEKTDYVPKTVTHTIDADPTNNTLSIALEHVKLQVNILDGSVDASDLILKKENAGVYVVVPNPDWTLVDGKYVTDVVEEGATYKVEVNKDGYYYNTNVESVTIENNNGVNVIGVSAKEFASIKLTDMVVGSNICLYKDSVADENLVDEVTLTADEYTFSNLEEGSYIVAQGNYRKSGAISVSSGDTIQKTKADLWNESELSIITIGTAPSVTYEGNSVNGMVNVLETSQTSVGQELTIIPSENTVIVGLVYYNGTSYESLISEKVDGSISLTDNGVNAFFSDEYSSADAEKVLYIITDKVIAVNDVTVQFGDEPNVTSFEQSELDVMVSGPFGNVAETYTLTQDSSNNPAVNEGPNGEFTHSTANGTFLGGKVDFTHSSLGNYTYAFDFTVNISLKSASQTLNADVIEALQQEVVPTVLKETTIEIKEVEIKFEGNHVDVQLGNGGSITATNTSRTYIVNTTEFQVFSVTGSHLFDQYELNNGAPTALADTDGVITLNEGTNTLRLSRSRDGLQSAEYTFIADTALPTISDIQFDYANKDLQSVTENYNYNEPATINSFDNIVISATVADVGQGIGKVELVLWGATSGVEMNGDPQQGVYEYTLATTDRRVSYFIRVTDKAGNITESTNYVLSIDRVAPISSGATYNGFNLIDGIQYGGAGASVTITFSDAHHNISPLGVSCSVPCTTAFSADGSAVAVTISFGNGEYNGITISCADVAGHRSSTVTLDNIVVDSVAPVVNVSLSSAAGSVENGGMIFYNGSVTANVSVNDLAINASSITSSQGTKLASESTEILSADGLYTYSVSALDMCGNNGTSSAYTFTIDTKAPEAILTFDNNDLINEKYYNAVRTATFTVKDVNFDPAATVISVESTGVKPVISQWTGIGDSTYQATVTFTADAEYVLTFECVDRAGNHSNIIEEQRFVIDKTAPVIEVEYDNNDVINGMYYSAVREATITVTEHNFVSDALEITLTASIGSAPEVSNWSSNGDVHTAKVKFDKDAVYTMQIAYTDVANNTAAPYALERFTIDTTAPELEIYGVDNNSANNDLVQPGIRYSDVNLSENVVIELSKSTGEKVEYARTETNEDGVFTILYNDFERLESIDDIYSLTVSVEDLAGNAVSDSIVFSVNRYGSNYTLVSELETTVLTEAKEIVVTEINVDPLEESRISYSLNGKIVDLEKGTHYTVEEVDTDKNWKKYTYVISADNFSEEGAYVLTLYSKDRATNVQDNKAKECDIEFVIDRTAPSIVVSGIKNDGRYTTDIKTISLDIQDNLGVKEVVVKIGDEVYATFTKEDLSAEYGVVSLDIGESNEWQHISVSATDDAGNEVVSDSVRIMVTSNVFAQWLSNAPLMIGTIAGAVVVVGGGVAGTVTLRKRKRIKK